MIGREEGGRGGGEVDGGKNSSKRGVGGVEAKEGNKLALIILLLLPLFVTISGKYFISANFSTIFNFLPLLA